MMLISSSSFACNLSSLKMDSLTYNGTNYRLYVTLCVGSGRTGLINGADQNTGRFVFGFFDSGTTSISAVSPNTLTPILRPSTCAYTTTGAVCPPAVNPFGWDCSVTFNPTIPATWFACIGSTVNCGDTATQCFQLSFTMNTIPDSVRVYGVEGANVASGGCYMLPDMKIDLSALLLDSLPLDTNHYAEPIPEDYGSKFKILNVYPNPGVGVYSIEMWNPQDEWIDLQLYNVLGDYIRIDELYMLKGKNNLLLDLRGLSSGIYILKLKNKTTKLVKL